MADPLSASNLFPAAFVALSANPPAPITSVQVHVCDASYSAPDLSPLRLSVLPNCVSGLSVQSIVLPKRWAIFRLLWKWFQLRLSRLVRWRHVLLRVPSEGLRHLRSPSLYSYLSSHFPSLILLQDHLARPPGLPPASSSAMSSLNIVALLPFCSSIGPNHLFPTARGALDILQERLARRAEAFVALKKSNKTREEGFANSKFKVQSYRQQNQGLQQNITSLEATLSSPTTKVTSFKNRKVDLESHETVASAANLAVFGECYQYRCFLGSFGPSF